MPLPALVFLALAAFAAALFHSPEAARGGWLHLLLAVGAMPLVFGAMGHFIPVLTRSRGAPPALASVSLLALAGGALAVAALGFAERYAWRIPAALLALAATLILLGWSIRRGRAALGPPHPGLAWYQWALGCLALALVAVVASAFWPQHAAALRRLHLHLNTLGFLGLTAVSTMAVLLPTALGRTEPQAGARLRRDGPLVLGGTLCVAAGAAVFAPLAWFGAALWAVHLVRLASAWRPYGAAMLARDGVAPALGAALAGFALSLLLGALSPATPPYWPLRPDPVAAYVAGFLPPLVTGAATQLLPVWLRPGAQTDWHAAARRALGRHNGARALLFLLAGAAAGTGFAWGAPLAAATVVWFAAQAVTVLVIGRSPSTGPGGPGR